MTKQKMFFRMITASLVRRRSRMLIALLAIAVGATILSGLVTIYYDVPRQMGAEFRNYGANMILLPSGSQGAFDEETVGWALDCIDSENLVGVAPYRYETVAINEQPILLAGTDMDGARATSPYWFISGEWPASGEMLLGQEVAQLLYAKEGDTLKVVYTITEASEDNPLSETSEMSFRVSGILETGGSEEEYVYISMEDLEALLRENSEAMDYDVVELSVSASQAQLQSYTEQINDNVNDVSAKLVKRVTQSEATVLTKLQSLVLLVTIIVLALTMICVATTMTAVVTERRKEIGLRKALGASDSSIIWEFMGEGLLLGGVGGLLGAGLGFAFAQAVSVNVFSSSIAFRPLLLPITVVVSILVTGLACILPVRSATEIDPALVLKGE